MRRGIPGLFCSPLRQRCDGVAFAVSLVFVCMFMCVSIGARSAPGRRALYCTRSLESGVSDACRRACLCPPVRAWPAVLPASSVS